MKQNILTFLLLVSAFALAARGGDSAEYDINVHVSGSRMVLEGQSLFYQQRLNVVIGGKKYELKSLGNFTERLMLGDYKARLARDERGKGAYDVRQAYEFQFPDKRT